MNRLKLGTATAILALTCGFSAAAQDLPAEGVTVNPMKGTPANAWFWHKVVERGLEDLGYEVEETREADFPALHLAVGTGDADYTANNWKPLHDDLFERAGGGDTLIRAGALISGAGQGYFIDKATADAHGITNIEQLKDPEIAALFDSDDDGKADLSGCNPGWGCELVIEHQLDEYGLRDTVEHDQGSYFAIMADTIARYENGGSILYYTWTPNWVSDVLVPGEDSTQLNVPFSALPNNSDADTTLEDGSNSGFAVNDVYIVANSEFLEDNPAAAKFFELVKIPMSAANAAQIKMRDGKDTVEDFERHAADWITENQEQWDAWIEESKAAAQ